MAGGSAIAVLVGGTIPFAAPAEALLGQDDLQRVLARRCRKAQSP